MGTIDDVRKVIQDLVAPELKALSVQLDSYERESKLRDEALASRITSSLELMLAKLETQNNKIEGQNAKLEAINAKMESQYISIMNALNLDRRVESLERERHSASA
jgi:TATA-binding protein-associated factor Taf7